MLRSHLKAILTLGRGVIKGITELTAGRDPIVLFEEWFRDAREAGILLPERMAVATATPEGAPSVRMMLLKEVGEDGFVFYTNYESRKGDELARNPRAALCFHWAVLERQVRVEGPVSRLSEAESAAYFRTRPRGSQIGAWASDQSRELADRAALERDFRAREAEFSGRDVPLPPYWGGFRLHPERIEFWQGRLDRLHDRLRYERTPGGWEVRRLAP